MNRTFYFLFFLIFSAPFISKSQNKIDTTFDIYLEYPLPWFTNSYFSKGGVKSVISTVYTRDIKKIRVEEIVFDKFGKTTHYRYGKNLNAKESTYESIDYTYLGKFSDSCSILSRHVVYHSGFFDSSIIKYTKDSIAYFNLSFYKDSVVEKSIRFFEDGKIWKVYQSNQKRNKKDYIHPMFCYTSIIGPNYISNFRDNVNRKKRRISIINNKAPNQTMQYYFNRKGEIKKIKVFSTKYKFLFAKYKYKYTHY